MEEKVKPITEGERIITTILLEHYNSHEANVRHISHQLRQPPEFRVLEGTDEELKEALEFHRKMVEALFEGMGKELPNASPNIKPSWVE